MTEPTLKDVIQVLILVKLEGGVYQVLSTRPTDVAVLNICASKSPTRNLRVLDEPLEGFELSYPEGTETISEYLEKLKQDEFKR